MSQTLSADVVGPSHWTFMATVMAGCLEQIARAGSIGAQPVPPGVYRDALAFWELALQATSGSVPDNLPALNAYAVASEALSRSSQVLPTRDSIDQQLMRYDAFLKALGTPKILDPEEKEVVNALRTFFIRLKEEGESEAYTQTMQIEPISTGFPFR